MIAVDRSRRAFPAPAISRHPVRRTRGALIRVSALVLVVALLGTLGGGGFVDSWTALALETRARALDARWDNMVQAGVPAYYLTSMRQEWTDSHASSLLGASMSFWLPGASRVLEGWEARTDAIWSAVLARYRSGAKAAQLSLRNARPNEPFAARKARLELLSSATTPADLAVLRDDWSLEARLVPLDARIATAMGAIASQALQAKSVGIQSDPAADAIARAAAYASMSSNDRMAQAELLTRHLQSVQKDLQARLDAAVATQGAFKAAEAAIATASYYGLATASYRARVDADRAKYAAATTASGFASLTADLNQVAASARHDVNGWLSETHIVSGVAFYPQTHPLSCEEAATSMALTHQGIHLSQDQILAEVGADLRPMYVDSQGRVRWGNAYQTFVGNVDGSSSNHTGLGTFYPPLVRVAKAHGAKVLAAGSMAAAAIYAQVMAGHPVVAFATWDWRWHPRHDYLSFDGQWIPWMGPAAASHVYVVVGVTPSQVLVNDPLRGQYWISKASFQAGYSDFQEAIVFA